MSPDQNPIQKFLFRFHQEIIAFLVSLVWYQTLQFYNPGALDHDLYFHAGIVRKMIENISPFLSLPEMFLSIHKEHYIDFHFLYHVFSLPFVLLSDTPITGMRISSMTFAALSSAIFFYISKQFTLTGFSSANSTDSDLPPSWMPVWTAAALFVLYLASSPVFTGRLLFARGMTLYMGLFYLLLYAIYSRKSRLAFILSFLSVWTYPGFIIFVIFAFVALGMSLIHKEKEMIRPVLFSLAGLVGALVVHPAFPHQFYGYYLELGIHFAGAPGLEPIAEWQAPERALYVVGLLVPAGLFFFRIMGSNNDSVFFKTMQIVSLLALMGSAFSTKILEATFPVLFFTIAVGWVELAPGFRNLFWMAQLLLLASLFWSIPQLYHRVNLHAKLMNHQYAIDAARWIQAKIPEQERIIIPWSNYPLFFYYAKDHFYPFGMNPIYAYGEDKNRYIFVRGLYDGFVPEPEKGVRALFARTVVVDKRTHQRLIQLFSREDSPFELTYQNQQFQIYQIRPE